MAKSRMPYLSTTIDLSHAEQGAIQLRERLFALRETYDLTSFEYCTQVCIAPYKLPHSHPVVTLNTYFRTENSLLATYIHEQMHWYVTWYSYVRTQAWKRLFSALEERYRDPPVGGDQGASDTYSSHLHLIVNWLEIEALAGFIGRDKAILEVKNTFHYRWIYARVLEDWAWLEMLYRNNELTPIRSALDMSPHDLMLAARMEEAR